VRREGDVTPFGVPRLPMTLAFSRNARICSTVSAGSCPPTAVALPSSRTTTSGRYRGRERMVILRRFDRAGGQSAVDRKSVV
jgi:hypothetical protein